MSVKLAVAGSVVAGLVAVGGVAVASTRQPEPARNTVELIAPVSVQTVAPTVEPTVAPVAVPTTVAPAPSAPAPAPVAAPEPEVIVPKVVQPAPPAPAPAAAKTYSDGSLVEAGKYPDGTPVRYKPDGTVILFPPGCANSDGSISKADWSTGLPMCPGSGVDR